MFNIIKTLRNYFTRDVNYYPTISAVKWHFTST